MSDYHKKVTPREPDPFENITVNPIEKDKKGKEEYPNYFAEEPSKSQIIAALISVFKRMLSFFKLSDSDNISLLEHHHLFEHLAAFRNQLSVLTDQDESYNLEFTQQLTQLWHNFVDDCNSVAVSLDVPSEKIQDIKILITQISQYPYGADHPLVYYFDAFVGKEWIPFPFMDMLKELYEEHQRTPGSSHLSSWISLIDDILHFEKHS